MKHIVLSVKLLLAFAAAALAQVVEDPSQYTSGAAEPATPNVTVNHVESNEPVFAISVHPVTMAIYSLVLDIPSLYLTVEGNINSNASIITRPFYVGKEFDNKYENIDLDIFGLSEGFRYYFMRGHKGWFASFHVNYEYISLEYTDKDDRDDNIKVTGNGIGIGAYLGTKTLWGGRFTTSWDIGVTYTQAFVKGRSKDDVDEVSDVGVGIDLNYTMGFAL